MRVVDPAGISLEAELERARAELRELNKIGIALMSERDPDKLLGLILTQARRLTTSDAGSLYLVEADEGGTERLHFLRSQNDTLPDLPSPDFTLPLDETSIAGYVAHTGEPLVLDDVYVIPPDLPFSFNKAAFDEKFGYRAKSQLVVPLVNHKDRVVGVVQLINRKSDPDARIRTEDDAAPVGASLHRARSQSRALAGGPGRGLHRERPALPGHREPLRRIHQGGGHRHRPTGSDDVRTLRARHRAHVRHGGPHRRPDRRPLRGRALHLRGDEAATLRGPSPRLRQGGRPRGGPREGEEAPAGPRRPGGGALRPHQEDAWRPQAADRMVELLSGPATDGRGRG